MKASFHFHSRMSYDGLNSIDDICSYIIEEGLDTVVLTDHDEIKGSRLLRKQLYSSGINCNVMPGVEYKTSLGDVIVVGLDELLDSPSFEDLVALRDSNREVYLVLPHPFDSHVNIDYLAENVDIIEVFNGRSTPLNNSRSVKLALRYNKGFIWSSDSHIRSTLSNVILSYEKDLMQECINRSAYPIRLQYSRDRDMILSQLKKAVYIKSIRLFLAVALRPFYRILNQLRK